MTHVARPTKRIYITVVALVAFIALILGLYMSQFAHAATTAKVDLTKFNGTLLTTPRHLDDFVLTGIDNTSFTKSSIKGHWTLMFFGYTSCSRLCPMTMAELAKMYKQLQTDKVQNLPQVLMVSLDPQRDSVQKLKQYVTAFNRDFIGAVGDIAVIEKMTKETGVAYMKVVDSNNPTTYTIQHGGTIVLLNPQGDIAGYFSSPLDAEKMAKDYEMLVS